MGHILLLMLGLIVMGGYPLGVEPLHYVPWQTLAATAALTCVYPLLGWGLVALLWRGYTARGWTALRLQSALQLGFVLYRGLLVAQFAAQIYLLHWPLYVAQEWRLERVPFAADLADLLPFVAALALSWIPTWALDRRLRGSARWRLGEYLLFQARSSFGVFLVPVLGLMGFSELIDRWPAASQLLFIYPALAWVGLVTALLGLYAVSPFLLATLLSTSSLPAGPLRERLDALARRAGFGYRDLRVWHTGGGQISNALVVGLWGRLRYVLLTDALLAQLTPEEIEAVFGHEVGHARYHHLAVYFIFIFGCSMLFGSVGSFLADLPGAGSSWAPTALLPLALGAGLWTFGHLSRRCERQADLFGAKVTGDPEVFMRALQKVADQNGIPRSLGSWRYFSIDRRVGDVLQVLADPAQEERHLAGLRRVLVVVGAVAAMGAAGVISDAVRQFGKADEFRRRYRAMELANQGEELLERGDVRAGERLLRESLPALEKEPGVFLLLGDAARRQGRNLEALELYRKAQDLHPSSPHVRMALQKAFDELARAGAGR